MNKVKIGFIISNLGQGGAERQFVELIRNIDRKKFAINVCLYAANKGVFYTELEHDQSITIEKNLLRSDLKAFKIVEALLYIRRYLTYNKFDIVLTTLFMNGVFVRLVATQRYKNRIISSIRTSLTLYNKWRILTERFFLRNSFVVLNNRNAENKFLSVIQQKYVNRISSIYNGYNLKHFYSTKNSDRNSIIIGNVGRQTYLKNQLQIINVFSVLKNGNIRLQIVGSKGDQSHRLNESIINKALKERVVIIDAVPNVEEYYKNFDIFILSSLYEGCPNVLFEAMLSKCFCIISKGANSDDFIIDGENGLVYDGTDENLEEKLRYAIEVKGSVTFDAICENGYAYAKENFSMEKMVKSYEELFLKILREYHNYNV